jgi:hypothetical protein
MNRFSYKKKAYIKKDDAYETPSSVLVDLLPYLPDGIVYDPFFCKGTIIEEWKKLDRICINEDKDAFHRDTPDFDVLVSNIPFSMKEKCVKLALSLNKPFALLVPIDSICSKWISKYFDELSFIVPTGRYNFIKNGLLSNHCWFDCCWICSGLDVKEKITKL